MKLLALAALLASAISPLCFAQGTRGELNGTVTDSSGSVVPAASIVATEIETNAEAKATTTNTGVYTITHLPWVCTTSV